MTSALTADALAELKGHADLPDLPVRVPPELMRALLSELEQSRVERKEMMEALEAAMVVIGTAGLTGNREVDKNHLEPRVAKIQQTLSRARQRTKTGE